MLIKTDYDKFYVFQKRFVDDSGKCPHDNDEQMDEEALRIISINKQQQSSLSHLSSRDEIEYRGTHNLFLNAIHF
ncbi:hypothetical protein Glove_65g79 [Diversispora epigaea]|uniref:Uncharacterized protein n=1 Tax=Diversispora epigaea TaxID=1348612 RepID=A0A397JAW9_9GLOM|nr:hypothetical protein Glove_65g79 [Diversispora epigaea]